jgi:DNA-binding CsgD family transcriptional regulator
MPHAPVPLTIAKEFPPSFFSPNGTKHRSICTLVKEAGIDLSWLGEPAIAIDRDGLVVGTNAAMRRLLGQNINIHNRQLRLSDAQARARLETLIKAMKTAQLSLEVEPIVVKRDNATPVVIRSLIIPEAAQTLLLGAALILTFLFLGRRSRPAPYLLSQIFGLTRAEARLTSELACGDTLVAAACTLNISWETARSQLKMVFAKTGTHRQGELVALLSCLSSV